MKNSASFDTKIVSLPIFSGYDQNLSYIYCTIKTKLHCMWPTNKEHSTLFGFCLEAQMS